MKNINVSIGIAISTLRHNAHLSQEELADKAGVHRTYISQIERAKKSPTINVLIRISKALNTSASKILEHIEKENDNIQN
ncbi:MAG: transcriptional regulator [Robiginitomaculum sp.]|nr:MAG: transcriptional regulator [Robiginitomaculum sp.]